MNGLGDTRFEIDGNLAIVHLPESIKTIRVFHGDSGSVEISAKDGKLEVLQPELTEA